MRWLSVEPEPETTFCPLCGASTDDCYEEDYEEYGSKVEGYRCAICGGLFEEPINRRELREMFRAY